MSTSNATLHSALASKPLVSQGNERRVASSAPILHSICDHHRARSECRVGADSLALHSLVKKINEFHTSAECRVVERRQQHVPVVRTSAPGESRNDFHAPLTTAGGVHALGPPDAALPLRGLWEYRPLGGPRHLAVSALLAAGEPGKADHTAHVWRHNTSG